MRTFFLHLLLFISVAVNAQIITTVAGNGTYGYSGDGGPAINAQLSDMYYTYPAFDNAGNMYIVQNNSNTIRKVDPSGTITTIAGTPGVIGYSGDGGPAVNALLYHPASLAIDNSNNIYFADQVSGIIRKIDPAGIITTVSGQTTTVCGSGDGGPLSSARFYAISGMTFDQANNLYISDYACHVIRKVNASGIINTIAGNGSWGFSGDGGTATSAQLAYPCVVAVDAAGNIYIPDAQNHRIRKVNTSGIISTIAGTGVSGYNGDNGPALSAQISFPGSVVIDNSGNLYFGDYNDVIRKIDAAGIITTFAGNGTTGYSGDGGPAIAAALRFTEGHISIDRNNINLYFVNYLDGNVIRKITNCITSAISQQPANVALCISGDAVFSVTASNTTGYQWQLNDGTGWVDVTDNALYSGSATNSLSVTGAVSNMSGFQYRCRLTNACGNIFTVAALLTVSIPAIPSVFILPSGGFNVCVGEAVFFTAFVTNGGSSPSYQWYKNGSPVGNNSNIYSVPALNNGDLVKCSITSSLFCVSPAGATSNTVTMTVIPYVTPTVSITASANTICAGTPVTFTTTITEGGPAPTYTWFKNSTNLFLNSPTYTDNALNDGDMIFAALRSSLRCTNFDIVISNPIIMDITPLTTPAVTISASAVAICKNIPVTFTATPVNGGTSPVYAWKKNNVPVGSNNNIYTDNIPSNGDVITCTLTSNETCLTAAQASSNSIVITVHPDPVVILDKTPTLCTGTTRILDAGNFSSYAWSTGAVSQTITVNTTGIYSVTVTDNNGCTGTGITTILTLLPSPAGFLPPDTAVCSYGNITLKATAGFTSYRWNTGAVIPSITISLPGLYWLEVTNDKGCTNRDTVIVSPKNCLKGFFMPGGFTPNNDGKNDFLKPILLGDVEEYEFWIYNRWGQIVFQTKDLTKGWNGSFKGLKQDGNVFVWVCAYRFKGEKKENKKGTFILIR